jgi:hypothetical protein
MLPAFDQLTGYLPAGEHAASWTEFVDRFGWNSHRTHLLEGMLRMAKNLKEAGCGFLLIDGSFVTAKELPSDYDACCDFSGINIGKIDLDFFGGRTEMKLKYFGELFPDHHQADDLYTYREFFQSDRDGAPKGVVRLLMESLP